MIGTTIARLLAWDHDVVTVTRARAALGRIEAGERFDAILCDVQMPDMSGMELHAKLAGHVSAQAARMVFMSGAAALASEVGAFLERAGARWIETPFNMTELRTLIQVLVASAVDQEAHAASP